MDDTLTKFKVAAKEFRLVMLFRLCNAAAMFEHLIDSSIEFLEFVVFCLLCLWLLLWSLLLVFHSFVVVHNFSCLLVSVIFVCAIEFFDGWQILLEKILVGLILDRYMCYIDDVIVFVDLSFKTLAYLEMVQKYCSMLCNILQKPRCPPVLTSRSCCCISASSYLLYSCIHLMSFGDSASIELSQAKLP